jgi:co-chaperonin GroES (HSP10)
MTPANASSKARSNAQWFSNGDVPDPEPLPRVPGYKILVRPAAPPEKTSKGGIILPDETREVQGFTRAVGRVLAVGDAAYQDQEKTPGKPWCSVGDFVIYGRHVGMKLIYDKVYLIVLNEDEVQLVTDDPSKLFD